MAGKHQVDALNFAQRLAEEHPEYTVRKPDGALYLDMDKVLSAGWGDYDIVEKVKNV